MDVVKICEVVDGCEDCPKYGDDCDGKEMTREEAVKFLKLMRKAVSYFEEYGHDKASMVIECDKAEAIDLAIEALSADAVPQSEQYKKGFEDAKRAYEIELARSADAVQGWRIGKPTEQGSYMVTLDSFGHKHIDLFYYGKPLMPNRKVRGKCWYRSDDEWGDVVYDDKEILAWQPLPTPYKGGDTE